MKAPDFTLEEVKEYLRSEVHYIEAVGVFKDAILDHIERLEAERDAAVEHVKRLKRCADCKHATITLKGNIIWVDCPKQDGRCSAKSLWEWRGVQKEG